MKVIRFLLWDLWVKIILWVLLFPLMVIRKVVQGSSQRGIREELERHRSEKQS